MARPDRPPPGHSSPVIPRRVVLTLGAGAARGLAHIGVLKGLEEDGVEVAGIAGASMGAMIGALKAEGFSASDMEKQFSKVDWTELGRVLLGSVIGGAFREMLEEVLGDARIENLEMPFAVVACDLDSGEEVVLREGPLAEAVSASSAIPGVLPPVRVGGRSLVDGALVNPVPVEAARSLAPAPVLAVNVLRLRPRVPGVTAPGVGPATAAVQLTLGRRLHRWVSSRIDDVGEVALEIPSRWEAVMRSFEIMEDRLARPTCRRINSIEPDVGQFGWFDFPRVEEIVSQGYKAYRQFVADHEIPGEAVNQPKGSETEGTTESGPS